MSGDNSLYSIADTDSDGKLYVYSTNGFKSLIGNVDYSSIWNSNQSLKKDDFDSFEIVAVYFSNKLLMH